MPSGTPLLHVKLTAHPTPPRRIAVSVLHPRRRRPPSASSLPCPSTAPSPPPPPRPPRAAPPPAGGSSPLDFISRAKARGASALATRRPWRELADPRALSIPRGLGDAYRRARANLAHFAANYALVVLLVVFVSLLWRPVSLLVFLACFAAWLFLYFLRDRDVDGTLVIFGRPFGDGVVIAVLSAVTLVLLLLTGATGNILISLLVGLLLVLLHAVLHRPADSIDEEAGRWYAPVPPST